MPVAPTLLTSGGFQPTVTSGGLSLEMYLSETVSAASSGFTIYVAGSPITITGYAYTGQRITLSWAPANKVYNGQTVSMDYSPGDVAGATNGAMSASTGIAVTNNSVQVIRNITGTLAASGGIIGTLATIASLTSAALAATATLAGALLGAGDLVAPSLNATAALTGSLPGSGDLSGALDALAGISGSLSATAQVGAQADATAGLTGALDTPSLSGALGGVASLDGVLTSGTTLIGQAEGSGGLSGTLTATGSLTAPPMAAVAASQGFASVKPTPVTCSSVRSGWGEARRLKAEGTMTFDFKKSHSRAVGSSESYPSTALTRMCSSQVVGSFGPYSITAEPYLHRYFIPTAKLVYEYGVLLNLSGLALYYVPITTYTSPELFTGVSVDVDPRNVEATYSLDWSIEIDASLYYTWSPANYLLGTAGPLHEGLGDLSVQWRAQGPSHPDGAGLVILKADVHSVPLSGDVHYEQSALLTNFDLRGTALGTNLFEEKVSCSALTYSNAIAYSGLLSYANHAGVTWGYSNAILSTGQTYNFTGTGGASSTTQQVVYGLQSIDSYSNLNATASDIFDAYVLGQTQVGPVRALRLKGLVAGLTTPLVEAGTVQAPVVKIVGAGPSTDPLITATGAVLDQSYTQRWEKIWNPSTNIWNPLGTTQYGGISASVDVSWMNTSRDYTNTSVAANSSYGGTLVLKDKYLTNALTLALASSNTLPAGTDSAITGGVRRVWSPILGLTTYRYLSVTPGTSIASGGVIRIQRSGSYYEWTQDRDGAALTGAGPFVIDLLNPTNKSGSRDVTATTFPEDTDGYRLGEGGLTGPSWLDTLDVIGTSSLSSVALVRAASPQGLLTCLNQQGAWFAQTGSGFGASTLQRRPFLTLATDGRVESISETDTSCNLGFGVVASISPLALTQLAGSNFLGHARNRGVTATVNLPPPSGPGYDRWYNCNLPAIGLLGTGWLWRPATQDWLCTIDTVFSASADLPYQLGCASMLFPANLGDLFGHANDGAVIGQTTLVGVATLHSRVNGVVVSEDADAADPTTIELKTVTGYGITAPQSRGTGQSGALGYYATGTDWVKGHQLAIEASSPDDSATILMAPRRLYPIRWAAYSLLGLDNHNPRAGQFFEAIPEGGAIRLKRWDFSVPPSSTPDTSLLVTSPTGGAKDRQPCLWSAGQERIYLLFVRTGGTAGIYEQYTDDNGATWSTPTMAIADAQQPDAAIDISGGVLRAGWVRDTGSIGFLKATWQAPGDASASAVFTFTNTSGGANLRVKNTGFSISAAPAGGSEFLLTCTIEAESATSEWKSSDDGRTWTRIT